MAQVREIKCPHCGEWTLWNGGIDDRCLYCDGFLETRKLSREVEKKARRQYMADEDHFAIKPDDSDLTRWAKQLGNSFRWAFFYIEIAFFIFVTLIIVVISFLPG